MSVLGIIFWLWLAVSVVVFITRRVKGRGRARTAPTPPLAHLATDPERRPTAEPTPAEPRFARDGHADPGGTSVGPDADDAAAPIGRDTMLAAETVRPPMPMTVGGDCRPAPSMDIAGALNGIRMPCNLAPLTLGVTEVDPTHVDLVTAGVGAGEVTAQLDAELTRLGYDVEGLGGGEHLATRDDVIVRVKVHERPALSVGVDGRGFPTAPPDGIVVELTVASR